MRALILRLAAEGITVLLSSHQLPEVQDLCDRVAIVHRGGWSTRARSPTYAARAGRVIACAPPTTTARWSCHATRSRRTPPRRARPDLPGAGARRRRASLVLAVAGERDTRTDARAGNARGPLFPPHRGRPGTAIRRARGGPGSVGTGPGVLLLGASGQRGAEELSRPWIPSAGGEPAAVVGAPGPRRDGLRWELRKLVSQKRTYLGLGFGAFPLIFVLLEKLHHRHNDGGNLSPPDHPVGAGDTGADAACSSRSSSCP